MIVTLSAIRPCFEGAIPAVIATCARDGTPNVSYISEVHYVDGSHVALTYQFFSKTRQNVLENPGATLVVVHPETGTAYRLGVRYLRTEESGPLFESMKAKLAGIASHTGMAGIFRLRGADVYRVDSISEVYGTPLPPPPPGLNLLSALRSGLERMSRARDLSSLLDATLDALQEDFAITHAMVLMRDAGGERLYAVTSRGYRQSGVGAELRLGEGVVGVAAQEETPIRITHATAEFGYGRAIRESLEHSGVQSELEAEIPFPGLAESQSQIAVPIRGGERVLGVLFAESTATCRFGYEDEDALVVLASQLGALVQRFETAAEPADDDARHAPVQPPAVERPVGPPVRIRRYAENDSIFVDEDYLIKGVAGAILWRLVRSFVDERRTEHSNRELRLDPSLRLPEASENLEARLILLQRRLEERCPHLRIEKTGRGRFRFSVLRPVALSEVQPGLHRPTGLERPAG